MVKVKLTRAVTDWLYKWRFAPWLLLTLPLAPGLLLPPTVWFEMRQVNVRSANVGEPIPLLVDRTIHRSFHGRWNTTIRQWDGAGWVTFCNATGESNYRAEAKFPAGLSLQWWTDGQCHPLPPGRYKVTTSWRINTPWPVPEKTVSIDSNVFEVFP